MSPLDTPRRIVTTNLSLPEAISSAEKPQPEVSVLVEDIIPVSLLGGNAAKWPIHTYQQVPTNANEAYQLLPESGPESGPHQGANAQINDLAPGAIVPLHRATQCDFMVLISGELILGVPAEPYDPATNKEPKLREVTMKPGDVVMQRGTLHSWRNPSKTEWTRLLGVGLKSVPVEVDVVGQDGQVTSKGKMVLEDVFDP